MSDVYHSAKGSCVGVRMRECHEGKGDLHPGGQLHVSGHRGAE